MCFSRLSNVSQDRSSYYRFVNEDEGFRKGEELNDKPAVCKLSKVALFANAQSE